MGKILCCQYYCDVNTTLLLHFVSLMRITLRYPLWRGLEQSKPFPQQGALSTQQGHAEVLNLSITLPTAIQIVGKKCLLLE